MTQTGDTNTENNVTTATAKHHPVRVPRHKPPSQPRTSILPRLLTDMSLPLQLLSVVLRVGKERGDVQHHLPVLERVVDGLLSGLTVLGVQAAPVSGGRGREGS